MSKSLAETARTFANNVRVHFKRIAANSERPRDALNFLLHDMRKLKHVVTQHTESEKRKRAHELTEKGRRAYNKQNYSRAEEYFQCAVHHDPTYALARAYLGSALYRLGDHNEAIRAWKKAIEVEPESEGAQKAASKLRKLDKKLAERMSQIGEMKD